MSRQGRSFVGVRVNDLGSWKGHDHPFINECSGRQAFFATFESGQIVTAQRETGAGVGKAFFSDIHKQLP